MPVKSSENDFFKIVQNTLLGWLEQDKLFAVLAQPPFDFCGPVRVQPVAEPLLKIKRGRRTSSSLVTWPHLNLEAKPNPFLAFILKGSVDLSVGVTEQMAAESGQAQYGLYHLRLPERSLITYPSNVPNSDGRKPHWEGNIAEQPDSSILWVDIIPEGALLHTCHSTKYSHSHGATRFVFDSRLPLLADWYIEELQSQPPYSAATLSSRPTSRPMLEILLSRISRALFLQQDHTINLEVLARESVRDEYRGESRYRTAPISPVIRACNYIHGRLSMPLSVESICHFTLASPTQLNRLFRAELGVSIMEYVNRQRLEMAKSLLSNTTLPVSVIGDNVGIPNAVYFSRMFREKTGLTPLQYRNQHR